MTLYVYGFVDAPGRHLRIARHRVEILTAAGVGVAVERLAAPPAVSEDALREQHRIVERLGRAFGGIVPARFGSFLTFEELEQFVRSRRTDLRKTLRKVRDRVQMTVRLVTSPTPEAPPRPGTRMSGTAYLKARRASSSGPHPPLAAACREAARALVRDERIEIDARRGRTALFHLIDRGDVRGYRAAVSGVSVKEGERVTVSGPYPPFAFAPELWP